MRLLPNTLALTAVLALLQGMGPLSTDLYLPSLPSLVEALDTDLSSAQLTLSVFLAGFAVGQLFYGPISDRIGRRPTLLAGLALYLVASVACAFAQSIELLIAARFLQALGAAGPVVLSRSIVRDLYDGPRAGTELARMGTIMGLLPSVAPLIGGFLETAFGWRSAFVLIVVLGAGATAIVAIFLPETLRARGSLPLSPIGMARAFRPLLSHAGYRAHVAIVCFTFAGLFSFISGSSFVLQDYYELSPIHFGLAFGAGAFAYVVGTVIGQVVTPRRGIGATLGLGTLANAAGGALLVIAQAAGFDHPLEVVLPQLVYMVGLGLTLPVGMAAALLPFPSQAGAASSLLGFLQMTSAALVGAALGMLMSGSAWPMVIFIAASGFGSLAVFLASRRVRGEGLDARHGAPAPAPAAE